MPALEYGLVVYKNPVPAIDDYDPGDLFLFTSLTPANVAPEDIFIARRWYQPFQQEAIALVDGYD